MQSLNSEMGSYFDILKICDIPNVVKEIRLGNWKQIFEEFDNIYNTYTFKNEQQKNIFTDLFFSYCLGSISIASNSQLIWELTEKWFNYRKLPKRCAALSSDEQAVLVYFCLQLRDKLHEYLLQVSIADLKGLSHNYQNLIISLWQQVFLNPFSALNLIWTDKHEEKNAVEHFRDDDKCINFLIASMYCPFDADEYEVDSIVLLDAPIPLYCKTVIVFWMINTPYFNALPKHRTKLLQYIPALCQAFSLHPEFVTLPYLISLVQELMTSLWRAAYIGGNNLEVLSVFGDFITSNITRFFPAHMLHQNVSKKTKSNKIRVGYISRNFHKQAVSYYMINRIIHYDKEKLEVYVFSLGEYKDEMTDLFARYSDYYEQFVNLADFSSIIQSIVRSDLDILIYPDIGMDVVTYILSGLQLAPVQCAMVGHGTTTGMPTIQYYISGDFEASDAQNYYREKLIKLPNLGAAQYLPAEPVMGITRKDLNIPEDSVVLISCANGIKHGPDRDALLIDILKEVPNAYIVLKPFASTNSIDKKFVIRIKKLAKQAGVLERLLIIPCIGDVRYVMGLLTIADIQLDTYPYGGWTTNMEALYAGLPIVTQEGNMACSRWGAGMLKAIGINEGIASNAEEYVKWAVRLIQDKELRLWLKNKINSQAVKVLFNGAEAQRAFESVLSQIVHDKPEGQMF